MASKKKEKKAAKKLAKKSRMQASLTATTGKPAKQSKPPKDKKIEREVKRVFGKRLKPEVHVDPYGATIAFNGVEKIGEDDSRRMIMAILQGCPDSPA